MGNVKKQESLVSALCSLWTRLYFQASETAISAHFSHVRNLHFCLCQKYKRTETWAQSVSQCTNSTLSEKLTAFVPATRAVNFKWKWEHHSELVDWWGRMIIFGMISDRIDQTFYAASFILQLSPWDWCQYFHPTNYTMRSMMQIIDGNFFLTQVVIGQRILFSQTLSSSC